MSMYVMPWNELNLIAHVGHIVMTLNLIWVVYVILKHKEYKALGIGLLISILLFVPYIAYVLPISTPDSLKIAPNSISKS